MTNHAVGTFTVETTPHGDADTADGVGLGRHALRKTFSGDLAGTGDGTMLTALTPVQGSAGYVAIERVVGTLHGRTGSFVFLHRGVMDHGTPQLSIAVVPDSGTGALTGLAGTFAIEVVEGVHRYAFDYTLPEPFPDRADAAFGCATCWPASADAAWSARARLPEDVLIDESHYRVVRQHCRACGQRFLYVMTEQIDFHDGEDPISRTLIPLTSAEAQALATGGAPAEADINALGRGRRSLRYEFPKGEPPTVFWGSGIRVGAHD